MSPPESSGTRPTLFRRAGLTARLDRLRARPGARVVVSAPFGFGKSNALEQLCEGLDTRWCTVRPDTTAADVASVLLCRPAESLEREELTVPPLDPPGM